MGNYVFTADALVEALERDAANLYSRHDMGGDIIPMLVDRGEACVYDFKRNEVPGSTDRDRDYWRDVGTLDSYHEAHLDLVSVNPIFNLYNSEWPIFTSHPQLPGAKFVEDASARDSIVCAGVDRLRGLCGRLGARHQRLRRGWRDRRARRCILDNVTIGKGAVVRNAILDKNVVVPDGRGSAWTPRRTCARGFYVSDGGVTVLGKGQRFPE